MTRRLMQAVLLFLLAACGAGAVQSTGARPFTATPVTTFESPWAMALLPGSGVPLTDMALVTEKAGKLWLVNIRTGAKQQVGGVPQVHVEGQGGFADVVAHPGFAGNQRVYLSFSEAGPNGTSGAAVGYGRLILGNGPPRLDGFHVIWRQQPKVRGGPHYSQRIAFAPDGT